MAGYVLLHRSLLGHPAFRNDAEALAFAWLVMKAAWRPTRVRYKDRVITLQRGQVAVSVRDYADALGRSKDWAQRFLKRLTKRDMTATATATGVLVITICNYNEYQADPGATATGSATLPATGPRQDRDTEQRREEGNEGNKGALANASTLDQPAADREPDLLIEGAPDGADANSELHEAYSAAFEAWWSAYPNKTGKRKAFLMYEAAAKRLRSANKVAPAKIHELLLAACGAQKTVWRDKGVEGRFIPHAATWLSQSRWEDEAVQKRMGRARQQRDNPAPRYEPYLAPTAPKPPASARPKVYKPAGWSPDDE